MSSEEQVMMWLWELGCLHSLIWGGGDQVCVAKFQTSRERGTHGHPCILQQRNPLTKGSPISRGNLDGQLTIHFRADLSKLVKSPFWQYMSGTKLPSSKLTLLCIVFMCDHNPLSSSPCSFDQPGPGVDIKQIWSKDIHPTIHDDAESLYLYLCRYWQSFTSPPSSKLAFLCIVKQMTKNQSTQH